MIRKTNDLRSISSKVTIKIFVRYLGTLNRWVSLNGLKFIIAKKMADVNFTRMHCDLKLFNKGN